MSEVARISRHGEGCGCTRCRGISEKNQLAATHRGYSMLGIGERAQQIADETRPILPVYSPADEPTLRLFAHTVARLERGLAALERLDEETGDALSPFLVADAERLGRLRSDVRGWIGTARRLAADLGLSPSSRAKLGLDIATRERALSIVDYYRARDAAGLPPHDDEDDE